MNMASRKHTVLIVDDAPSNIRVLAETLMSEHDVRVATNGLDALDIAMSDTKPDLILLDVNMPDLDGYEVCRRLKEKSQTRHIPVIFITARTDIEDETRGLELDAVDYIAKPFSLSSIRARVRNQLELKRHRDHLDEMVKERTAELIKANQGLQDLSQKLRRIIGQTVNALMQSVELRDPYTSGHQQRVKNIACAIAEKLGMPEEVVEGIRMAGLLHDIGKICVPSEILSKPGKLTAAEFMLLKEHPVSGFEILKGIEFARPVAQIVKQHHEKLDGSGYPSGLTGDSILFEARILCVADVVEAMSSHRPYRPSLGIDIALKEILKNKGIMYDPDAVTACVELFEKKQL